jgi:hypothetical protein
MLKTGVLMLALSCLLTDGASAQEPATRAEADRNRREEKAAGTQPYEPNGLERAIKFAETKGIFILDREGFYPKLGSLTVGSGFAYGLGFRHRRLFENTGALDLWAAASIRRYNAVEARLTFPRLAGNHLHLETWASRRDYPQENFFGLGPDSRRADRSDYAIRTTHVGGRAGVRPVEPLLVGGGLEYLQPRLGRGSGSRLPDLPDIFQPSQVPGFQARSDFLRSDAFIEVDYREPRNARQGGWYRFDYSHYDDRTAGTYTFNRLDADVRQFIGFLAGRRVIAARIFVATSDATGDDAVPFYYMPTLGGNDTLRGFREYRFRGPHAMLFQGEYRWEIWSGLDAALFYDTGKVANRRSDLDWSDLERDYGFGFRFNTDNGVVFRVDAAFGSRDGKHLHIVFGGIF